MGKKTPKLDTIIFMAHTISPKLVSTHTCPLNIYSNTMQLVYFLAPAADISFTPARPVSVKSELILGSQIV